MRKADSGISIRYLFLTHHCFVKEWSLCIRKVQDVKSPGAQKNVFQCYAIKSNGWKWPSKALSFPWATSAVISYFWLACELWSCQGNRTLVTNAPSSLATVIWSWAKLHHLQCCGIILMVHNELLGQESRVGHAWVFSIHDIGCNAIVAERKHSNS